MRSLKVSYRGLRLGTKNPINSEHRQRKAGINKSLLNFLDRRSSASKLQKALVVEASLKYNISCETWRLKVVPITNCALEVPCCHASSAGLLDRMN
jgi:hypothetical protein